MKANGSKWKQNEQNEPKCHAPKNLFTSSITIFLGFFFNWNTLCYTILKESFFVNIK